MHFRITGLSPEPFRHLYGLSERDLAAHGVERHVADTKPGFPDRIELRDAEPGEAVLLLNFRHQPADTPYRSSHAIFVLEGAESTYDRIDNIPEVLRSRVVSLRAFDPNDHMVAAELLDGRVLEQGIDRLLADRGIEYLHAHYATRGCYAARITRA